MEKVLSIVIITSPSPQNPSTCLIQKVIDSLKLFNELETCDVNIVLDGYVISSRARSKRGKITKEMALAYEEYYNELCIQYGENPRFSIARCDTHQGFAMAVKFGLSLCVTSYAIILQHDRRFCCSFNRIMDCIHAMEKDLTIRYIGFPSILNRTHDLQLHSRYNLSCLNSSDARKDLGDNLFLQPLIFWYDSNHLCHIQRYLEIYRPYETVPSHLVNVIGKENIKDMKLRKGDFIEDRFGQFQRKNLTELMKNSSDSDLISAFRWYGSYLAWAKADDAAGKEAATAARVLVVHLRGRTTDPLRAAAWRLTESKRLRLKDEYGCGDYNATDEEQSGDSSLLYDEGDEDTVDCVY